LIPTAVNGFRRCAGCIDQAILALICKVIREERTGKDVTGSDMCRI